MRRLAIPATVLPFLAACAIRHVEPYTMQTAPAMQTADAATASTNCFEASTVVEHMACANADLAALNKALTETLQGKLRDADPFGRDALLAAQRVWLLGLPATCDLPNDPAAALPPAATGCVADEMRRQTRALAAWHGPMPHPGAIAQYVHFTIAPGSTASTLCNGLARGFNDALQRAGTVDPAAVPGAREIAGTHGPAEATAGGGNLRVEQRMANAFGGFGERVLGISLDGKTVLDNLSLGNALQATAQNAGARFSAYASQTGDYGAGDVFAYQGRTLALLADDWGFYAPASPGEFAHAGVWDIGAGTPTPLCLFQTFQRPAESGDFDTLPSFTPWRDTLRQIRDSTTPDLGVSFVRDQAQLRTETEWRLLYMPLVASAEARSGGWVAWLRLRHDAVLDALFSWSTRHAANKALFDEAFALLKPAAEDLARAYQQTEALNGDEAKEAAGLAIMEFFYGATINIAPDIGADLQAPESAAGRRPRYPILALPQ